MLINIIKTGLFLCSICVLGFFTNAIIHYVCTKKRGEKAGIRDLPLFFLLGSGAYTFYAVFFSIAGIKSHISHFAILFIVSLLIYSVLLKGGIKQGVSYKTDRKNLLPAIVIALAILLPLLISLVMAMAFPQFDIDMLGHILIKAKILTTDTYKSSVYIHDDLFANIHSKYPPFVGLIFNLLFLFGGKAVACYQIVNYFILLLVGITLYSFLKHKIPLRQCLVWFFVFISTKAYISSQFIIDSTDVLLSLSFLLSIIWFIKFIEKQDAYSLAIAAVLTGISTLIKNEALLFSVIMAFIWLRLNKRTLFKYLLIWFFITAPWILYRKTLPQASYTAEHFIGIANIMGNLKLESLIYASGMASRIICNNWNRVFLLLIPATIILWRSKYRGTARAFFPVIISLLAVYFFIITLHVGKTGFLAPGLFRILSHTYPMAVILLALATERLMFAWKKNQKSMLPATQD